MASVTGANGRETKRREIAERYHKTMGNRVRFDDFPYKAMLGLVSDTIEQAKAEIRAEAGAAGVKADEPEAIEFEIKDSWGDTLSLEFREKDENPFSFTINRDKGSESACFLPTRGQVIDLRDKLDEILAASE